MARKSLVKLPPQTCDFCLQISMDVEDQAGDSERLFVFFGSLTNHRNFQGRHGAMHGPCLLSPHAIGAGMVFGQVDEILDAFLQAMVRPNAVFDSTGIQLLACLASF